MPSSLETDTFWGHKEMSATINQFASKFEQDYKTRINPELITKLAHQAVPVLEHTGWEVTHVGFGFAQTRLPLNAATTNQHGTHQAALISLSADYTGGMALTSVLTGIPLSGIHKCRPEEAASMWLASMDVKYINPSTGHLTGTCRIDDKTIKKIQSRYFQGKRVLVSLPIEFTSNGQQVATAQLRYFVQPTIQLLDNSDKPSALFKQKLKASARMIAGVRASEDPNAKIRVDCPHAATAAGPHGALLAKKLRTVLPQLTDMVLARTEHIDQTINQMGDVQQVVMLGAGLDMRPFRFTDRSPEIKFFELDLPAMLEERERVIAEMGEAKLDGPQRISIAANFLEDNVADLLMAQSSFDPKAKTLFVYEGCSMYFTREENLRVLRDVWKLAKHPESQLWCDLVSQSVVSGETTRPEITAFLNSMDDLGESFIFGSDDPSELLAAIGCRSSQSKTCRSFLQADEPIFDVYQFCVGRA